MPAIAGRHQPVHGHSGDGPAGPSLQTHVQPHRVRIGTGIVRNIHRCGPRQTLVNAVLRCFSALEMNVIAVGIG